jgi:hypothetical protein
MPLERAADAYAKMMSGKARFRIALTMAQDVHLQSVMLTGGNMPSCSPILVTAHCFCSYFKPQATAFLASSFAGAPCLNRALMQ